MDIDTQLESAKRKENLNLDEVLKLAGDMDTEIKVTPETKVFKGGQVEGKKVVLVPEGSEKDEEDILAGEILHELGHIRFKHYGSGVDTPDLYALNELQANNWALTTKGGYPLDSWDWSILPGIAGDVSEHFGMNLWDAWLVTKKVAAEAGVSKESLRKAEEEVKVRS